ncbi:hypothetical protein J2T03_001937 [Chryseobacterium lathyri]|nr:hypothetical protein [Chryseobacterium lathyri]
MNVIDKYTRLTHNQVVPGSSPGGTTTINRNTL